MDIEIPNIFPRSAFFALILTILLFSSQAWSDHAQMRDEVAQFHSFMIKHPLFPLNYRPILNWSTTANISTNTKR